MRWYVFRPATFPEGLQEAVDAIGGPFVRNGTIHAPTNAAWMVEALLRAGGVPFAVTAPPSTSSTSALVARLHEMPEMLPEARDVFGILKPWPDYLTPFQREGVLRVGLGSGSFWWAPGAGKALGAIVWLLLDDGFGVFTTRSGGRRTIWRDFKRFTSVDPIVLEGQKPYKIPAGTRAAIIGWEVLPYWVDALIDARPTSVVWDEIHKAKSYRRQIAVPLRNPLDGTPVIDADTGLQKITFKSRENISASARKLAGRTHRRLGTTASAIKDRIRDLWAQLDLVEPGEWGRSFYVWAKRYANAHPGRYGGVDTSGCASPDFMAELSARLSFSVHSVPYSVTHGHLPTRRRSVTYIAPADLLKEDSAEVQEALREGARNGHAAYAHAKLAAAAARKRTFVVDLVRECIAGANENVGGKVVVFSGLRKDSQVLFETIKRAVGAGVPCWFGTGDHSIAQRDRIQEEYMSTEGPSVLVGTGQAWGETLNLQRTDHAVMAMLPWTPAEVDQREGRFLRQGSDRSVLIHYPIAEGTYDEHVASVLISKLPAVTAITGNESMATFARSIAGLDDEEAVLASLVAKLRAGAEDDDDRS